MNEMIALPRKPTMHSAPDFKWTVNIFGQRLGRAWEISVVRTDNEHGLKSWGWFDDKKLLVSHNGGPCHWSVCGFVWDQNIAIADELCRRLNAGEDIT